MIPLKARRILILESISSYIAAHGRGPTVREIGVMAGLRSSSSVAFQLAQLEKGGLLVRSTRSWTSAEVTGTGRRRLAAAQSITAASADRGDGHVPGPPPVHGGRPRDRGVDQPG